MSAGAGRRAPADTVVCITSGSVLFTKREIARVSNSPRRTLGDTVSACTTSQASGWNRTEPLR